MEHKGNTITANGDAGLPEASQDGDRGDIKLLLENERNINVGHHDCHDCLIQDNRAVVRLDAEVNADENYGLTALMVEKPARSA